MSLCRSRGICRVMETRPDGETAASNEQFSEPEQNNHDHQCYCGRSVKTFRGQKLARSCYVLDIPDLKSRYEVSLQGTVDGIEKSNEENEKNGFR